MYTLEQLQAKTFKELKAIGYQLDALPAGDKRSRQNWIDAIAGVNPPLLKLLEVSPAAEVESVAEPIEIQATEPIEIQHQEPINIPEEFFNIDELFQQDDADCPACGGRDTLFGDYFKDYAHGFWTIRCTHCHSSCCTDSLPPCLVDDDDDELVAEPIEIQHQEPIEVQALEPQIDSNFGRIVYPKLATEPIAQAAETLNGVENFTEADRPPNRGDGKGRLEVEPELSQSAIEQAAKTSPGVEWQTSIAYQLLERLNSLTDIIENFPTLSDSFLARYSPPRAERIYYQADADGQLNLLDFEVESTDEPPDPDDFESIDAFREAMREWDNEHPPEPLEVSIASMCEWAPCPLEWYEPETNEINETVSGTLEISPVPILSRKGCANESSSTCNFSIPTFDAWRDRPNGRDEPPTAGVGARLPKPKPPSSPPASVAAGDRSSSIKKFARATLASGRSPPGGDAM